jgi:hypothetical protein
VDTGIWAGYAPTKTSAVSASRIRRSSEMRKSHGFLMVVVVFVVVATALVGCATRQAERVSYNLSHEADSFNIARKLTVINQRTDTIIFQVTGNFSLQNEGNNELVIVGENKDGRYYKHFVFLSSEISYIVEDLGATGVSKYQYEINFNPKMLIPVKPKIID